MTVAELIKKLVALDPTLEVDARNAAGDYDSLERVSIAATRGGLVTVRLEILSPEES